MGKRNRNIQFNVRLDKEEYEKLKNDVSKSGLSLSAYIRLIINGYNPVETPPADFFKMIRELHFIGVNLNQIAKNTHYFKDIDNSKYDKNFLLLEKAILEIQEAILLPKKIQ